jgi:hypothetical protein
MHYMKKQLLLFIIFFLALIYSVPIVQAIVEMKNNRTVQALDIITDATITPVRRASLLHDLAIRQSLYCDSLMTNPAAGSLIDEALMNCAEMKRTLCTINRHVSIDSTGHNVKVVDSVTSLLSQLQMTADEREAGSANNPVMAALCTLTARMTDDYPEPSPLTMPLIAMTAFKYIFWNDRYLRPFEKELENHSILASTLRPQVQLLYYVLFGDLGAKGIKGCNGWFFYKPDIEYLYRPSVDDPRSRSVDYNDKTQLDDPVAVITDFKQQLEARGIELLVVIVPGKGSVYPDLVTAKLRPDPEKPFSPSIKVLQKLHQRDVMVVDLFGTFLEERRNDSLSGDSLYLARDTHWRSRGLRLAAHRVAETIQKRPWYGESHNTIPYSIDSVMVDRIGDIGVMTDLQDTHIGGLKVTFASEMTKCYPVMHNYLNTEGVLIKREPYRDDFRNSRILILGDSFSRIYQTDKPRGAGWIAHLALELSEPLASIISDGGASTLVREKLARNPGLLKGKRLVIWEFVERDLRYGAFGWKQVTLPSDGNVK